MDRLGIGIIERCASYEIGSAFANHHRRRVESC